MAVIAPPTNKDWLKKLVTGQPHIVIPKSDGSQYLRRWYIIPRNKKLNVYLHHFLADDDDRALHDHPWWFITLILKGGYFELTEINGKLVPKKRPSVFDIGSPYWKRCLAYRPAEWRHRVVLPVSVWGDSKPCWTIIITGPNVRQWGFWCKRNNGTVTEPYFKHWQDFEKEGGCGEYD